MANMTSSDEDWLTWAFSPHISTLLITLLVVISSPLLLHLYLYRQRARTVVSRFLLLGPSGAGKTSLAILLQSGETRRTHTSQETQTIECRLNDSQEAASQGFRSNEDPTVSAERNFLVVDTPGHGKLRHHASELLSDTKDLRGIIFVADAAALSKPVILTETATYLHDVLLQLQKQHSSSRSSKGPSSPPLLIAANKLDLFTALPAPLVRKQLEEEITKIRATRSKGLLDSADDLGDDREWLGEGGEGPFKFTQMMEAEIDIKVAGGNVLAENAQTGDIKEWWTWIGENM